MEKTLKEIDELQLQLIEDVSDAIDYYSKLRMAAANTLVNTKDKAARYFPVMKNGKNGSIYIYWRDYSERAKFRALRKGKVKKEDLKESSSSKHGEHVRQLGNGKYSRLCFSKAPEWELKLILEFEEKFKEMREANSLLMHLRTWTIKTTKCKYFSNKEI